MVSKELYYTIALSMVPGIGHIRGQQLIEHCEGAEATFQENKKLLLKLASKKNAFSIDEILEMAKKELDYIQENNITALSYTDPGFPKRLKECADHPLILYTQGNMNLDQKVVISIVGSRNATIKGREFCKKLIQELSKHDPLIISGLAYGMDITAHNEALKLGLQTVAVVGSGLKIIYPNQHRAIAKKMMENGGLISDYPSETKLLPAQFAERNRIVAGLSDATIVVESAIKGGSMITARLAMDYDREVYAVPGRPDDELSKGCHHLIKKNKAALIESAADVEYYLGLDQKKQKKKASQTKLFQELSSEEKEISKQLTKNSQQAIDEISLLTGIPIHKTSVILLELEFKGIVRSLPGKMYQLV